MALRYHNMIIPWARDDLNILGFALGIKKIVSSQMQKIQHLNLDELPTLAQIYDGLIHFQFSRLCVTAHLLHFLHGPHMIAKIVANFPHAVAIGKTVLT